MNDSEFRTSYGKVSNISRKKKNRAKLVRNGIFGVAGATIVLVSSLVLYNYFEKKKINDVPEGQITTTVTIQVEKGDTLSEITDRFYTDNCEGVYRYVSNYQDAIQNENHIYGINPDIRAGDTLEIPVVIYENNAYYQRILELEKQIADMEQNNKWVRYTVRQGDLFSTLAQQVSVNISETYELAKDIANQNGMNAKDMLRVGQEIWTINPELGILKNELVETKDMFISYLSSNQIKK